jgi:zinc protease
MSRLQLRSVTLIPALLALTLPLANQSSFADSSVVFERDAKAPIVNLALTLRDGAIHDPQDRKGLTNFVGEMLLRGTRHRTKKEFDQEMDRLGASLAVEVRAEAVILRGSVLSRKLTPFLALVSEAVTEQAFEEGEVTKLRNELLAGLAEQQGRDPKVASDLFTEFLFNEHPYGNPILGTIPDVQKVTRADVEAHYKRMFHKENLLLVGSGDAEEAQLNRWMEELTAKFPKASGDTSPSLSKPTLPQKRRVLFIDKPERTQCQILLGQSGIRFSDPSFFPLHIGNFIFGGGSFSSRLMQEIRVKRGWSYGASSNFRFGTQPRSWSISLMPKTTDAAAALKQTLQMVDELKQAGVTDAEFDQAKNSLVNGTAFMGNTQEKRLENEVLETTLNLPSGFMKTWQSEIRKVSRSQVNTALKDFIQPEEMTIVVLGTATPQFLEAIANASQVKKDEIKVIRYTDSL